MSLHDGPPFARAPTGPCHRVFDLTVVVVILVSIGGPFVIIIVVVCGGVIIIIVVQETKGRAFRGGRLAREWR